MENNAQHPVAWVWQFPDGELYEDPFGTKSECEQNCAGYDGQAIPLYTAPLVPRDVLMAVLNEVNSRYMEVCGAQFSDEYIAAIADRYASKVQPERSDAQQARIAELEANNTALLYLLAQIREACGDNGKRMQDELVAYIGELAKDATSLRIFVAKVAQQTPEKPDHWNACGQCERNAREADDLIGNDK